MLIEVIRAARDATQKVNDTKAAMRDVCSVSSRSIIKYNGRSASHSDSVVTRVQILDCLEKQLTEDKNYARECLLRMEEELKKVPDPTTRLLFRRRYYDNRKWDIAARSVGLSTAAAKMRCKRYTEQEVTQNAA